MTLREKIDGLDCWEFWPSRETYVKCDDGEYISRADVLRIIDEHEQGPIPDWTKGGVVMKGGDAHADVSRLQYDKTCSADPSRPNVTSPPVGQSGGEETFDGYIARLRTEVEERRAALELAMSRTSLYDHEQEMLENSEMELADAFESAKNADEESDEAKCEGCGGVVWLKPDGSGACPKCNAWRLELARLLYLFPITDSERARLTALQELDALRFCIDSGNGEAAVPGRVADLLPLWKLQSYRVSGSDQGGDKEMTSFRDTTGKPTALMTESVLVAIDRAGNALVDRGNEHG